MSQVVSTAATPPGTDIDSDSSEVPSWPASRGPDGETIAAVEISGYGQVYGRTCSAASRKVNQSVCRSIRSSGPARNRARIASSDSCIIRRCSTGSIPIM